MAKRRTPDPEVTCTGCGGPWHGAHTACPSDLSSPAQCQTRADDSGAASARFLCLALVEPDSPAALDFLAQAVAWARLADMNERLARGEAVHHGL